MSFLHEDLPPLAVVQLPSNVVNVVSADEFGIVPDGNIGEYSIRKNFAVFANLRNVNDPTGDTAIAGPDTPAVAQFRQRTEFGALWTFGIKGTF